MNLQFVQDGIQQEAGSLPDSNTAEAILYGPAYSRIKSILWAWDEMEDYLIRKADSLNGQIMDREWAYNVIRYNRYLLFARSPPVNEVSKLNDLFTLRSLCKCVAGIHKINEYRRQNIAWARMKGIEQYVGSMAGRGISENEWKAATASYNNQPITYDYVHSINPSMLPGEILDWDEAMKDLMGDEEYDGLVSRIFGIDVSDVVTEKPVVKKEEEPVDTVFWNGLSDDLDMLFSRPDEDVLKMMSEEDDEFSYVRDYWLSSDIDNRGIIDQLIKFAEAM